MPTGISEISNKIYSASFLDSFCGASASNPFLNYVNGNGNNKCFYSKQSANGTGWTKQFVNGRNAYCSTIENNTKRIAEVVFKITAPSAGYVGFSYYGSCESGSQGEKIIDGLIVSVDNGNIFRTSDQPIKYDMASGTVSDWTSFKKQVSQGEHQIYVWYVMDKSDKEGLSKFCIDDLKFFDNVELENMSSRDTNPSNMTCNNSTCKKNSGGACYGMWCGDGTKNGYEICDKYEGTNNNDNWAKDKHCNGSCTGWGKYCGDGIINGTSEQCDGSEMNGRNYCYEFVTNGCNNGCDDYDCYYIYEIQCDGNCKYKKGSSGDDDYQSSQPSYPACSTLSSL